MAREMLAPGSWGKVAVTFTADGRALARGRYRDLSGAYHRYSFTRGTEALARAALSTAAGAAVPRPIASTAPLTATSPVTALGTYWIAKLRLLGDPKPQTIDQYEWDFQRAIVPTFGSLRINEVDTPLLEQGLLAMVGRSRPTAIRARKVLSMMFDESARLGLSTSNPVRATTVVKPYAAGQKPVPRVLSLKDTLLVRSMVRDWERAPKPEGGTPRRLILADIIDIILGTSLRIGEVLALRGADVAESRHTITIAQGQTLDVDGLDISIQGTMVYQRGAGYTRQSSLKGDDQRRIVFVTGFAEEAIRRHLDLDAPPSQTLICTRNGKPVSSANVRRALRAFLEESGIAPMLDADPSTITPHTFRRTVATEIANNGQGAELASKLLGHADIATLASYVKRAPEVDPITALFLTAAFTAPLQP